MKINRLDRAIAIEGIRDFALDHIFDCGQCFRWRKNQDGSYDGIAYGKPVTVDYDRQQELLIIYNTDFADFRQIWLRYFDLERDYGIIKERLSDGDPVMAKAVSYGEGIRILNQEKWETLLSFIISQNNNIPRIRQCIDSLAENFGEFAGIYRNRAWYNLPLPSALAELTEEDLAPCRLGYRAKYLIETARRAQREGLGSLERLGMPETSSEDAFRALQEYCGVGAKVANCVALFSMGKLDRFPVDVWVRKVMNRLYGLSEGDLKGMERFAADKFGPYGGIAQQYLFYYITHQK